MLSVTPLPVVPESKPEETVTPTRVAVVEYDSEKIKTRIPMTSVEDLIASLQRFLSITDSITVQYKDEDFDEYMTLKDMAALPEKPRLRVAIQATTNWWSWGVDSSWVCKGFESNKYHSLCIKEGSFIYNKAAMDKFKQISINLGFALNSFKKVYAISNPALLKMFEGYRDTLHGRHRANPALFKREDWTEKDEAGTRATFLAYHSQLASKFPWNDGSKPRVIPMLQGTSEAAVWQICQQGFSFVGTTDDGFYGKGAYFTSKLSYAEKYAKPDGQGNKPFLISMVIPGNTFPITESPFMSDGTVNPDGYKGKACRVGCQSHFTLVDGRDINTAFPIRGAINADVAADELITFDQAQALPLFVFYK
jgi:hypothetical protein